jgi:hypothetical protein
MKALTSVEKEVNKPQQYLSGYQAFRKYQQSSREVL